MPHFNQYLRSQQGAGFVRSCCLGGVGGQHTQALEFILPDGNLYQHLEVEFDTATAPTSQGEPAAVAVHPVAGTFITQRFLLGTWMVQVFLDDQFISQASFTLEPGGP